MNDFVCNFKKEIMADLIIIYLSLTDSIINIKNSKGEIIDIVINNAKIDSKSISMRFIEEH